MGDRIHEGEHAIRLARKNEWCCKHICWKQPTCWALGVEKNTAKQLNASDVVVIFQHTTAKILYFCKHDRQDIQTAIEVLCKCGKNTENNDSKKLSWVQQYLHGTWDMSLTLSQMNTPWLMHQSWIKHRDMKYHTGGATSSYWWRWLLQNINSWRKHILLSEARNKHIALSTQWNLAVWLGCSVI